MWSEKTRGKISEEAMKRVLIHHMQHELDTAHWHAFRGQAYQSFCPLIVTKKLSSYVPLVCRFHERVIFLCKELFQGFWGVFFVMNFTRVFSVLSYPQARTTSAQLTYATLFFYSAGGVELLAKQGRIKVVNTLESRLEMMSKQVCRQVDGTFKPRKTCVVYCSVSQFGSKLNSGV